MDLKIKKCHYIEISCGEKKDGLIELAKLKRQDENLYRKCENCQRMVMDYAERCLQTNGRKPQITEQNFKDLLRDAQKISQL